MNTKSFALWYDANYRGNSTKVTAEMHYNFWKLPIKKKGSFERFFDIGIKLTNIKQINELKFYVPLSINKTNYQDLGRIIATSNELLCAVFNAKLSTRIEPNTEYYGIGDYSNKNILFHIYALGESNVKFEEKFDGTIMSFSFTGTIPENDTIYIRFRLKGECLAELGIVEQPTNSILQSAFSNLEMLDIRVNEARVLDNKLLELINSSSSIPFSKTHFFFICNTKEEYVFSHVPPIGCRRLENDKWKAYIGDIGDKYELDSNSSILAYHWKIKEDHEEYSVLVKTKYEQNNVRSIIKYL